jgi:hypothetical protein
MLELQQIYYKCTILKYIVRDSREDHILMCLEVVHL